MLKLKKPVKAQNKNRVRPAGRTLPKSTHDKVDRAFPIGNALFFFTGGMMSLFCLPCGKLAFENTSLSAACKKTR